jgi:hypothetical protein
VCLFDAGRVIQQCSCDMAAPHAVSRTMLRSYSNSRVGRRCSGASISGPSWPLHRDHSCLLCLSVSGRLKVTYFGH